MLEVLQGLIRDQGDASRCETPFGPVCFFNHPDGVQAVLTSENYVRSPLVTAVLGEGLLASDGSWWRRQRRLLQPHFHEPSLARFAPAIVDATLALLRRWEAAARPVDVARAMRRLTLEIIATTMFGADLGAALDDVVDAFAVIAEDLGGVACGLLTSSTRIGPSRNADLQAAVDTLDRVAHHLIADGRQRATETADLLSLLLAARDETTGKPLSERQLRDEVVTMLIAGSETSATVLGWALVLLAEHPTQARRVRDELDDRLAGRPPSAGDLAALGTTRRVLEETMRLYPPVWFLIRRAVVDDEIAGLRIPAGAAALVCPYTTHRHAQFWSRPDQFDPDRFAPAGRRARHPFAYFPFIGGRHHCLGHAFAMMELQLVLAAIAQRCELLPEPGSRAGLQLALTLRQDPGWVASVRWR